MNIVTICEPDAWIDTHLVRFMAFAKKVLPSDTAYHLIMPYDAKAGRDAENVASRLASYFTAIRMTEKHSVEGRLLYYDWLRSYSLTAFNLREALYIDCDTDILTDISAIPEYSSADLLWTPNGVKPGDVQRALKIYGLTPKEHFMEPAVIYFRRSFVEEFERIMNDKKLRTDTFVPGSGIWNIIMHQHDSTFMLPYAYNQVPWDFDRIVGARVVHYAGERFKKVRHMYTFDGWPDTLQLHLREPVEFTWEDVPRCVENAS